MPPATNFDTYHNIINKGVDTSQSSFRDEPSGPFKIHQLSIEFQVHWGLCRIAIYHFFSNMPFTLLQHLFINTSELKMHLQNVEII